MITMVAGLLAVIFALIAALAHFFEKGEASATSQANQAVKDQVSVNDAKIQANQTAAAQIAAQTAQTEAGETNDQVLTGINNLPKS
jgi:hypothetical protein